MGMACVLRLTGYLGMLAQISQGRFLLCSATLTKNTTPPSAPCLRTWALNSSLWVVVAAVYEATLLVGWQLAVLLLAARTPRSHLLLRQQRRFLLRRLVPLQLPWV